MKVMKKSIFLVMFLIAVIEISAQQVYRFEDNYGRIANVGFSGNNMLVEQGGVVKAFFIPPYSNNIYTWVSEDGSNIFFTPDMSTMSIYTGGQSVIFKIQAANNNMYAPNNNYNQYNNQNQQTTTKRTCGLCNGTGFNPGKEYPPSFGTGRALSSTPCKICNDPYSHWHKKCPGCNGKGYY